ncbi:hypothetical protein CJF32_00010504 [Rutstroemia sp. NJR-2017a WRK4]|nr:hypothetical protein CJF32_00010504 [Rutstroemia sp. NJR-2017a WRK4]
MKLGYTCQPQFRVTQHERDLIVLKRIIDSMGCGTIVKPSEDRDRYTISVANILDLVNIVIPLFEKYPLYGAKLSDFLDFCKGVYIIKDKGHLTPEGLKALNDLAYAMNTYREGEKSNSIIYNSILKNGYSNFTLDILEYCTADICIHKEQYYINLLKPEYNLLTKADSWLGYKHTEETLAKMAASHLGKTHSLETRAKFGKAVGGKNHPMFGKPRAIGAGKPSQKILVIDLEKNTETIYISFSEAAAALALLFLGAGAVIHAVADNQDFRKYGGLRPYLPLTYSVMLIASLSLVAFPFMTGFYSKDFILESAYGQFYFSGTVVYFIATMGAMFTTLYSVKVLYLTFLGPASGPLTNYNNAHEGDLYLSVPLIILAVFSIFFGYITKDIFIGLGSGFFSDNSIFIHPMHEIMLDTEFAVPTLFKLLPLFFTLSLTILAIILSEFLPKSLIDFKFSRLGYSIFGFFNQRFFIEMFYNRYVTNLILNLGGISTKIIDKGSVEMVGPYGLEKGLVTLSSRINNLSTGLVTTYALYVLIALIFFILLPHVVTFDYSLVILILCGLLSLSSNYTRRRK